MALPDIATRVSGVQSVWMQSGGTHNINMTSLANNSGCEGDKLDLYHPTYGYPAYLDIDFSVATVSATSGVSVELYIGESAFSGQTIGNPGGLSGYSRAITRFEEAKLQLNFAGAVNIQSVFGTGIQTQKITYFPTSRAIIPAVSNKAGVALSPEQSNLKICILPWYNVIQD